MPTPVEEQWSILSRNAVEILPEEDLREKLASGRPLRVKLGCDPTAGDVHIGWAVVLRKLREFQDLGHTAVLIVGDFTARVGDPSGQNKTRPMLSKEEVETHAARLLDQFTEILSTERLEVRRNSEWLERLDVADILRLTWTTTVAQMLQRDDFAKRHEAGAAIRLTEFLYPLLQGYDSVAVEADIELGGTDQTFNLLVGRSVQEAYGQSPQAILTTPLLEGTDGEKKMSQSLGNYIPITAPPDDMFGKLMRVPDPLMEKYLRLATTLTDEEIEAVVRDVASGNLRPEEAKRRLAEAVVALYHGSAAGTGARERFDRVFREHELPEDIAETTIPADCVDGGKVHLAKLLKVAGLAASTSEVRRLIRQAGVRVDGDVVQDEWVAPEELVGKVVQVGKRRFVRVR